MFFIPGPFVYLAFGYLVGLMCSAHIFADLSLTHWSNIWVWFWLLLWPLGLTYFFFYYLILGGIIVVLVLFLVGRLFDVGPFARSW